VIAAIIVIGLIILQLVVNQRESTEETVVLPPVVARSDEILVEGRLVPKRDTQLSFDTAGLVESILVEEGQQVNAGDPIVRLDDSNQQGAFDQAEAALRLAETQVTVAKSALEAAQAGIVTAEVGVLAAEANLALVKAGALPEEIAAAEQEIEAAIAGINQAAANRDATLDVPDSQIRSAEANVAAARSEVEALQEAYDTIIDTCFDLPDDQTVCPLYGTVEENTRGELEVAQLRLQAAQAGLDALLAGATAGQRQAAAGAVTIALSNRDLAEAQLALLLGGPSAEEVKQAEIQVEQAEAAVDQAGVAVIQAEGAVAQAEAGVLNAQAQVAAAQNALDRTVLSAVFPGTVGRIDVEVGQLVSPGIPVVILADLSEWQVLTDDLSELEIGRVELDLPVAVELDAIPGETLQGSVSNLALLSEASLGGDVLYVATIDLEPRPDLPLKWGMTAQIDIETD
jgi:multidrug resistance efflux pump